MALEHKFLFIHTCTIGTSGISVGQCCLTVESAPTPWGVHPPYNSIISVLGHHPHGGKWWPMGLLACVFPTLPFCSRKLPAEPPCLSQPSCFYQLHYHEWGRFGDEWAGSRVCSSVLSSGFSYSEYRSLGLKKFFGAFFTICWVRILLPQEIGRLWNAATHCTASLLLTLVSASLCDSQADCLCPAIYTLTLHCYHFCWGCGECWIASRLLALFPQSCLPYSLGYANFQMSQCADLSECLCIEQGIFVEL